MLIAPARRVRESLLSTLMLSSLALVSLAAGCSKGGSSMLSEGEDSGLPNPPGDLAMHAHDAATGGDAGSGGDAGPGVDLARMVDAAPPPDLAPLSTDPFEPASCGGGLLNLASKFPAGSSAVVLATYTMKYESRPCTDFTGCGSWGPATPSWAPSGSGKVWLKVTGSGIVVAVVDNSAGSAYGTPIYNLGMDCALKGSLWDCGTYHDTEIAEGANFLRFEGKDKFSGVELPVSGDVRDTCARFFGTVAGKKSSGSYKEYRGGFIVHY